MNTLTQQQIAKIERNLNSMSVKQPTAAFYLQAANDGKRPQGLANAEVEIADALDKHISKLAGCADIKLDGNANYYAYLVQTGTGALVTGLEGKPIQRNTLSKRFTQEVPAQTIMATLRTNEGCVSHFYLDKKGKVTIGIGFLYMKEDDAKNIPLRFKDDASYRARGRNSRSDVQIDDIKDEWNAMRKFANNGFNRSADKYEPVTVLRVETTWIEAEYYRRFNEQKNQANSKFELKTLPPDIQIAFVDLIYQIGIGKYNEKYRLLPAAMNLRDWETAGKEMNPDPGSDRDKERVSRGKRAAQADPYFHRPSVRPIPLVDLVGR